MAPQPTLETIQPDFGHSFTYQKFTDPSPNTNLGWHYHPEIELVYVNGGNGKRRIGSHISYYTEGDLILIGPNLPHCAFTDNLTGNKVEVVVQMKQDFLGTDFFKIPEMRKVLHLLEMAREGIAFYGSTKDRIGEKMEVMEYMTDTHRLLSILNILDHLGNSDEFKILNAGGFTVEAEMGSKDRINQVFNHIKTHFQEEIAVSEVADMVSMTVPSFSRYFKQVTNKTFTQFLNEYRLVHASKLLTEGNMSITEVCFESGFNNFSHFNKQFKSYSGQSPSAYRKQSKIVLQ